MSPARPSDITSADRVSAAVDALHDSVQICTIWDVPPTRENVLDQVGARLRDLRQARDLTLVELAARTGLTPSTLSRVETGRVRPTLDQVLALAEAYGLPLDDLVQAPPTGDPRVHLKPRQRSGLTVVPLTRRPGGVQVYKVIFPPLGHEPTRELQTHDGHQVFYVLDGAVRFVLADRTTLLGPGEATDFDARTPHWIGSAEARPAELLMLFGPQGERALLLDALTGETDRL